MTITFTLTREELREEILRKLGVGSVGQTPSSEDSATVYRAIDMRLKEIHRLGIFWRKVTSEPLSFTLSAGVKSASATSGILFPISMTIRDGSQDEPLEIISPVQYAEIEDKSYTGLPEKALWMNSATFTFWPVPVTTTTVKLVYEKYADDTAASTSPDVDASMMRWLRDLCAYDLGDHFRQSEQKMARLLKESIIAERNIRKLNALHVTLAPVAVDDFGSRRGTETDYGMNT